MPIISFTFLPQNCQKNHDFLPISNVELAICNSLLQAYNLITARELEATDIDTTPADLTFVITRGPEYGRLENTANPTVAIYSFTQGMVHNVLQK